MINMMMKMINTMMMMVMMMIMMMVMMMLVEVNESGSWSLNLGIGQIVVGDKIVH